jgi:hypothetical protein
MLIKTRMGFATTVEMEIVATAIVTEEETGMAKGMAIAACREKDAGDKMFLN